MKSEARKIVEYAVSCVATDHQPFGARVSLPARHLIDFYQEVEGMERELEDLRELKRLLDTVKVVKP